MRRMRQIAGLWAVLVTCGAALAHAQYFGRNKVQYQTFDFQILHTAHFDLYFYPDEAESAGIVARMAERWQSRLAQFFGHELRGRQPVILYAVGAHFRQTNAIEGLIGEGTGGVTEPLRRRVVLPMSGSLADTDHVLGHELVHAFQFDLTGAEARDGNAQPPGILAFPLWYVEGMAEYLSLGPVDAQTAMWMRDAALHEAIPRLRDLDDPKYFPYRWGHAFWAFVGAKYGDRMVASLIRSAANPKFDLMGLARQLGTTPDALDQDWHAAIRAAAQAAVDDTPPATSTMRLVVGPGSGGGHFNIGPRISPDGKQIAFFSERDRFSIEMYLADAESGRIERKLLKSATDPHFDSLEFLNSAGAWSPDGKTLAVTAIRDGKPVMVLLDPRSGDVRHELALPALDDAINPMFSPDGRTMALSGNAGGLFDLYLLTVSSGHLERLTHDAFADLEPVFTPDGRSLVFVTERFSTDLATLDPGPLRLAEIDLDTKAVRPLAGFLEGKHISPQVSADGTMVTFVADPDGVPNLYRMPRAGGPIERLSAVATGVAGITSSSPALSASASGRLAFSLFEKDGQSIYVLEPDREIAQVPPVASQREAVLPGRTTASGDVARYLSDSVRGLPPVPAAQAATEPYERKLGLDSVGQPTVIGGVTRFGGRVAGSVSATFSDMLGDHLLGVAGQVGGTLADLGGNIEYVNRRRRWNWAASADVTPYYSGGYAGNIDPATNNVQVHQYIDRQISRGVFGTTFYPFNAVSRMEFFGGAEQLTHSRDVTTGTYAAGSFLLSNVTTAHVSFDDPLHLATAGTAFVRDTAYYGATGPIYGSRLRFEISRTRGTLDFATVVSDWRRYFFLPFRASTISVRVLHYGRYGPAADDGRLVPVYVGYPELVHGYGVGSFSPQECLGQGTGIECPVFQSLLGSRMLVGNFEVRAPLKGLLSGQLEYGRLPIDVAAFMDAGVAWTGTTLPTFFGGTRRVVRSVGGAVRLNILNIFALEVAASHPLDRIQRGLQWQIGVREGF